MLNHVTSLSIYSVTMLLNYCYMYVLCLLCQFVCVCLCVMVFFSNRMNVVFSYPQGSLIGE